MENQSVIKPARLEINDGNNTKTQAATSTKKVNDAEWTDDYATTPQKLAWLTKEKITLPHFQSSWQEK